MKPHPSLYSPRVHVVEMEPTDIRIGTCGYSYYDPGEGWRDEYVSKLQAFSDAFDLVELNRTFYDLPMVRTAERWRDEVIGEFEFTIKAWQALTHPTSSPTWRDTDDLTEAQREGFGYLRPNAAVRDAWDRTREIGEALAADVVVLQTPPSFDATEPHESNMRELLTTIDRGGLELAWEPRGSWLEAPDRIEALCENLDLIAITDVLRKDPLPTNEWAYARLHGLNDDPYDYDYVYSADELARLSETLEALAVDHGRVYTLFNNFEMYDNATALIHGLG